MKLESVDDTATMTTTTIAFSTIQCFPNKLIVATTDDDYTTTTRGVNHSPCATGNVYTPPETLSLDA
jgi:hypothetical protein